MPLQDASTDGDWPINSWSWLVDGLTSLSGSSVSHLFPSQGDYQVQLLVEDQFGCVDSIEQTVTVHVRPDIDISVADECENELFPFTNNSSITIGTIDSIHWDMGDGTTYNSTSPAHSYTDFDVYDVALYMESDFGCSADTIFQVEVFPNPSAALQWSNVCDGTSLPLTDLSSVPLPGQLVLTDWDLGNGTVLLDTNLSSYDYSSFGAYGIQLSVETQHGCTDLVTVQAFVHPMPTADFNFANICETDSALFIDESLIAQGNIDSWFWEFGNAQTFNGQNPTHQSYLADDFYPISLTVTSDSGCVNIFSDTIEVYPAPIAAFAFDSVCFPYSVSYTDLSSENGAYPLTEWSWEFSDGQISGSQSPQIGYPQFGAYSASLLVTNQAGCTNQLTIGNALVHPLPTADYTANVGHCHQDSIMFADQSSVPILSNDALSEWVYSLDDGNSISQPNGVHVYGVPGFYNVDLTVTTNHGCEDEITQVVEVYPLPEVAFDALPKEGCQPLYVQFLDQSSIEAPYVIGNWQWDLGDFTNYPQIPEPFFVYNPVFTDPFEVANYDISLTLTTTNGCVSSASVSDMITVHPVPEAFFSTDPEKLVTMVNPLFDFTDFSSANVIAWDWEFGDGAGSGIQHPEHMYADSGSYRVRLIVETDFGCADTITYTVMVEPLFTFYIPDAFTPNADGINDLFFGQGEYLNSYTMQIYDRWGEMIFESNDPSLKWDGTYKATDVESGQYVYKFYILDWQNHDHEYIGSVMLLK